MAKRQRTTTMGVPVQDGGQSQTTQEQTSTSPTNKEGPEAQPQPAPQPEIVTVRDLFTSVLGYFRAEKADEQKSKAEKNIRLYLQEEIRGHPVAGKYNIVFLYNEMQMVQGDADSIYKAVTTFEDKKPILLVLHSSGGDVGSAYLIGKLLQEYAPGNLEVVVPRRAKSAATIICCAADHIHMGSLSELGPIDPQFRGLPVLGLKSAIQHIAELVAQYPHATELFSKYMTQSIPPIHLGYYERIAESAVQYAERLLHPHAGDLSKSPEKIAKDLVYSYKDHGFVIDRQEAQGIFGEKVVKHNTEEYHLGNGIYSCLILVSRIASIVNHSFYMIGSLDSDPHFMKTSE